MRPTLRFDTRTREDQAERLTADIERAQTNPRPDYYLAVIAKDTDTLIGFARIVQGTEGEEQRSGEVGAALRKDRWRQGFITEATTILLDVSFDTLGRHRVQAACGPDNTVSQAILPKVGFDYEARIRDQVFTDGAWRDFLRDS